MFDICYVAVANVENPKNAKVWHDTNKYSCREDAMAAAQAACRVVQKLYNNTLLLTYRINFADKYFDENEDDNEEVEEED